MYLHEFVWLVPKQSARFDVGQFVELAFFNELYLTLQTDFAAR